MNLNRLRFFFRLTGLYSDPGDSKAVKYFIIFISTFVLSICWYSTFFHIYFLFAYPQIIASFNSYYLVISWNVQESIAIVFFIYWNQSGRMEKLLQVAYRSKAKRTPKLLKNAAFTIIASYLFILLLVIEINVLRQFFKIDTAFMNGKILNPFQFEALKFVSPLLGFYKQFTFHLSVLVYILASAALYAEFEDLNQSLRNLKEETKLSIIELKERLHYTLMVHINLVAKIREVNKIIQLYSFVYFLVMLPTLTFTLVSLLLLYRNSTIEVAISLPELMICIFELLILCHHPSNINLEATKTDSILCSDDRLWDNRDLDLGALARSFLIHSKQHDIGISLYGFIMVTKQLVFTAISVAGTYLIFFIQTRQQCSSTTSITQK